MADQLVRLTADPGKTLNLDDRQLPLDERIRLYREVYGLSEDQARLAIAMADGVTPATGDRIDVGAEDS